MSLGYSGMGCHQLIILLNGTERIRHLWNQTDIMWYPKQIDQRVISTDLDLIAYDIPKYHASSGAWAAYRAMQRKIALSVDGITTISKDVAKRLYQETPGLDPKRIQAIPLGLDHITADTEMTKPKELKTDKPFLLVPGNDFLHKNRDFAIKVWQELLDQGQSIDLVLAGLHVRSSSSKKQEQELIDKHVNLRGAVHILGHVGSNERTWLLANAQSVIYPSSAEGFGFIPHEAAVLGTLTTLTRFGPLREFTAINELPGGWSVQSYVSDTKVLHSDDDYTLQRLTSMRNTLSTFTWSDFSIQLTGFVRRMADTPAKISSLNGNPTLTELSTNRSGLNVTFRKGAAVMKRFKGK